MGGTLNPDEEARFRERGAALFRSKLRWASLAAAVLFAAFTLLDVTLDETSFERHWPMRLSAVIGYLGLSLATRWRQITPHLPALFVGAVAFGAAAVTRLSLGLEPGETLAVGSLMLMIALIAALGPRFETAVVAYAALIGAMNFTAVLRAAPMSFLVSVNAFVLAGTATGAVMAVVTDRLGRRAFRLELELEAMATRDSLTGARNRASFLALASAELERARRYGSAVSLLLLDIDRFKSVNDTHGHPAGDAVIRAMAEGCRQELRTVDLLGRLGGEEFGILLPETQLPAALAVAERLRTTLADLAVEAGGKTLRFTVSIGAAVQREEEPLERLIFRADEALYAAKRGGRNQVQQAA